MTALAMLAFAAVATIVTHVFGIRPRRLAQEARERTAAANGRRL